MTDLDDLVDQWHNGDDPRPLHEFLGMTLEEYNVWVLTGVEPPKEVVR